MFHSPSLNATDVASILHVGRNAVYALAKSGELRSYKVGRKILFSMRDVQDFLEVRHSGAYLDEDAQTEADAGKARLSDKNVDERFVIAGQGAAADLLIDRLQTLGMPASRKTCGSYMGLFDIYNGKADDAMIHLYDQRTNSYNIPYVQRLAPGTPIMVFRLMRRWQGFAVSKGNPKNISSWGALLREDVSLANRRRGCGSRVLLDEKLMAMQAVPWAVKGYDCEYDSALSAADAVASGIADVTVIGEQAASQIDGIDFIKIQHEWLDIAISKKRPRTAIMQRHKVIFRRQVIQKRIRADRSRGRRKPWRDSLRMLIPGLDRLS